VEAAKNLDKRYKDLVKDMHSCAYDLTQSFGIPEDCLSSAPIASDYIEFNKLPWTHDNRGLVTAARL